MESREAFLRWWYDQQPIHSRQAFIASDDLVATAIAAVHNQTGQAMSAQQMRDQVQHYCRSGLLVLENFEAVEQKVAQQRENVREYGTPSGAAGIRKRIGNAASKVRAKVYSPQYLEYINGDIWWKRAICYLNQRCLYDGRWICQACGREHDPAVRPRTIQVHHTRYDVLDGREPDQFLAAFCEGFCHDAADVARRLSSGNPDPVELNDSLRSLFEEAGL